MISAALASEREVTMRLVSLRCFAVVSCFALAGGCSGAERSAFDRDGNGAPEPKEINGSTDPTGSFGGDATGHVELDPKNTTVVIDTATNPASPGSVTYKVLAKGNDVSQVARL